MVVSQQFVQEVDGFIANEPLVLLVNELVPALLRETSENVVVLSVQLNIILVQVVEQLFSS